MLSEYFKSSEKQDKTGVIKVRTAQRNEAKIAPVADQIKFNDINIYL